MAEEEVEIPDLEAGSSASLVARWVLMLSHLYYDRGVSLVDDATYDDLCRQTVEAWEELPDHLQQQIDDPDALLATGMGVFLSRATVGGAEALARSQGDELTPYEFRADYVCGCCEAELATIRG